MTTVDGMLSLDELSQRVKEDSAEGSIDTVLVLFSDLYGRLLGKRFDADFFINEAAASGTHGCDYLLTTDMEMEPVPGYRFANWERGYGDFHLVPDLDTLRVASWLDRTAMVLRAMGTGSRFESIARGVIDLRDVVYYLSLTLFFLILCVASLRAKRWQ